MSTLRLVLQDMDVDAPVVDVVANLSWTVLDSTKFKHLCFPRHLPNQGALQALCTKLDVKFTPDLLDALDSDTPPTIEWFKTVPQADITTNGKRWGIYVVVLEKDGCRHKVHIGSGTESKEGIRCRMRQYERLGDTMAK
jgi:hypothetical protein